MADFRMPAEWEPQSSTWTSWPHNVETWPENLAQAQSEFVALVKAIANSQPVVVIAPPTEIENVKSHFSGDGNVQILPITTNDAWARDYAPTFVKDQSGELVAIDWYYNAWGGKYPPFDSDQQVAKAVADFLGIRHLAAGLCCEGGAIEINSGGVLLTTESCLLNPNRNAGLSRHQVETFLKSRLGCQRVVWLPGDVAGSETLIGDDTDGHVDQLARFVDDITIVHAWVKESDPRHQSLTLNMDALRNQMPDVKLVPLMLPDPLEYCQRHIPASYCNFLITNDSVIVPQFDVPADKQAVETLADLFTARKILPLPSRNIAVGLGSFHCLTQQQPK